MPSDGRIAGLMALAIFVGLSVSLAVLASRWSGPVTGHRAPVAQGIAIHHLPLLCVTPTVVCGAPALPEGYPCTCSHPVRGSMPGWVARADDPGIAAVRARMLEPPPPDEGLLLGP